MAHSSIVGLAFIAHMVRSPDRRLWPTWIDPLIGLDGPQFDPLIGLYGPQFDRLIGIYGPHDSIH